MSTPTYGFGNKKLTDVAGGVDEKLDFSGLTREPIQNDPQKEREAINRGVAIGFADRSGEREDPAVRRRRKAAPQGTIYIKGPKEITDWFIEHTNNCGYRSYWEALAEFKTIVEKRR